MRYKQSIYTVIVDSFENGDKLVYNTYSGICGIMDTKTQNVYENIEHIDLDESNLNHDLEILIQHGYIVDIDKDELATFQMERLNARVNCQVLCLTIAPTMSCNMRCPYCYEAKSEKAMSLETQNKLIKFVQAHFLKYPDLKRLNVTWYGGEPLLQKDIIFSLTKAFTELCSQHKVTYDASIITNGSLLDEKTAKALRYDCNINRAQITIDGMPPTHNKRRIFSNGAETFDVIVQNIDRCRSFMNVSIRMNIDKTNASEISEFLKFAVDTMHWDTNPKIYIAPVNSCSDNCSYSTSDCFTHSEFSQTKIKFQKLNYSINRNRVVGEFFPYRTVLHCGAERNNSYVIDPEGNYYTCWMLIGDEQHKVGHIDKPFTYTGKYYKWLSSDIPNECKSCEYLPLCAGGCGYYRIIKKEPPHCITSYFNYKDTLKLAYHDYLNQKSK